MKYLFLFLTFSLCTCTKFGKNVTIKGRVLNPITGEGIPGIELELLRSSTGLPGGYKSVKSTRSASDGSFEISKGGLAGYWLACRVSGEYYQIGWIQNGSNVTSSTGYLTVKKGKTMHADFYAVPYGQVNINIKNTSCFNTNDELKLYFDGGIYDGYTFNPGLVTTVTGCVDIPGTPVKSTMGYKYFHWEVTKNNITTSHFDTVYVNANEIINLNVYY